MEPSVFNRGVDAEMLAAKIVRVADAVVAKNARETHDVQGAVAALVSVLVDVEDAIRGVGELVDSRGSADVFFRLLDAYDWLTVLVPEVTRALEGVAGSPSFVGAVARNRVDIERLQTMDYFRDQRRRWPVGRQQVITGVVSALRGIEEIVSKNSWLRDDDVVDRVLDGVRS